eukprot:EG_transcript_13381
MLQAPAGLPAAPSALSAITRWLTPRAALPEGPVGPLLAGPRVASRLPAVGSSLAEALWPANRLPEQCREAVPSAQRSSAPPAPPTEEWQPGLLQLRVPAGSATGNLLALDAVLAARRPVAIDFGANSETVVALTAAQLTHIPNLRLTLAANAHVHLLLAFPAEPLHHRVAVSLLRGAKLHLVALSPGSPSGSSQDFDLTLNGEGAEADIQAVSLLLSEAHKARVGLRVTHNQPKTRCTQLFQSVADEAADYQFDGTVTIRPGAHDAHAAQLSHNLLLHDTARVRAQPRMHILADDVTATHGATTGGPAPEGLFYLQARGLGPDVARTLYWQAFVRRAVDGVQDATLRAMAAAWVAAMAPPSPPGGGVRPSPPAGGARPRPEA